MHSAAELSGGNRISRAARGGALPGMRSARVRFPFPRRRGCRKNGGGVRRRRIANTARSRNTPRRKNGGAEEEKRGRVIFRMDGGRSGTA